jgi:hypothetical protein
MELTTLDSSKGAIQKPINLLHWRQPLSSARHRLLSVKWREDIWRSGEEEKTMGQATALFHLARALRRAAGRVFVAFFLTLIIVAVLAEGLLYALSTPHQFTVLGHIATALMAVGWAVAISLFVLVAEVVRGLVAGARDAAQGVEREVGDAGKLVEGVVQSVERRDKK